MDKLSEKINTVKLAWYLRKSSRDGEKQVLSITSQEEECGELSASWKLPRPIHIFKESRSAKIAWARQEFTEMVRLIEAGTINVVMCWHLNRLARNMREGGILIDLLSEGKLKIVTTNGEIYDENSDMSIVSFHFGASKQYSANLSRDVKRGHKMKAYLRGLPPGIATVGFLNSKQGEKGTRWWNVDQDKFWKVGKILEMFLTGNYSANKLHIYATNQLGLVTTTRKKLGGKPFKRDKFNELLKNPIHAGFFYVQGTRYELDKSLPRHITENEHEKILNMFGNRKRPKVQKHKMLFSGYIFSDTGDYIGGDPKFQMFCDCKHKFSYMNTDACPKCKLKISEMVNARYYHRLYYSNVRKRKNGEPFKSIEEQEILKVFKEEVVDKLQMPKVLLDWSKKYIQELRDKEINDGLKIKNDKDKRRTDYERKKQRTRQMYRDQLSTEEEFKQDMAILDKEYADLDRDVKVVDWYSKMNEIVDLSEEIKNIFEKGSYDAKRNILSKIGANLIWNDKNLIVSNRNSINKLIEGIKCIAPYFNRLEPKKVLANKGQNDVFDQVCLSMRNRRDSNPRDGITRPPL